MSLSGGRVFQAGRKWDIGAPNRGHTWLVWARAGRPLWLEWMSKDRSKMRAVGSWNSQGRSWSPGEVSGVYSVWDREPPEGCEQGREVIPVAAPSHWLQEEPERKPMRPARRSWRAASPGDGSVSWAWGARGKHPSLPCQHVLRKPCGCPPSTPAKLHWPTRLLESKLWAHHWQGLQKVPS